MIDLFSADGCSTHALRSATRSATGSAVRPSSPALGLTAGTWREVAPTVVGTSFDSVSNHNSIAAPAPQGAASAYVADAMRAAGAAKQAAPPRGEPR